MRHFCVFQPLLTPNMPSELCNLLICTLYNFHPNDCLLGLASGGLWRSQRLVFLLSTAIFRVFLRFLASTDFKYVIRALQCAHMYSIKLLSLLLSTWFCLWRPLEASNRPQRLVFLNFGTSPERHYCDFITLNHIHTLHNVRRGARMSLDQV